MEEVIICALCDSELDMEESYCSYCGTSAYIQKNVENEDDKHQDEDNEYDDFNVVPKLNGGVH